MFTHDCNPTLTDRQVIEFCREGFLEFPAAVARDVTDRAVAYVNEHPDELHDPYTLLQEDWFVDGLVFHPEIAGALRSLLGAGFSLPPMMSNHAGPCPEASPLNWHVDGGNAHTFALNNLLVFCLMQDTTLDMGPTEILPGSHFLLVQSALVGRYGSIRGTKKCIGPAGTVLITCYPIWHRRAKATATGMRHVFKYNYVRNTPPKRDWVIEDDFDPAHDVNEFSHLDAGGQILRRNKLDCHDTARMYLWLCGHEDEFRYNGGVAWPIGHGSRVRSEAYGVPPSLQSESGGYQPNARPRLSYETW